MQCLVHKLIEDRRPGRIDHRSQAVLQAPEGHMLQATLQSGQNGGMAGLVALQGIPDSPEGQPSDGASGHVAPAGDALPAA